MNRSTQAPMLITKYCNFFVILCIGFLSILINPLAHAQDRIGILMLHGKNPGGPTDPNFTILQSRFEKEGMLVLLPDMPWSRNRYISGNWDQAMMEITEHVKALRSKGATKIVLVGHSMGTPAALSFASRKGDVQGIVMLAPGHAPSLYYTAPKLKAVRESIDEARAIVAANKSSSSERFNDINQGRTQTVVMTPRDYLTYFDPESDAEMSVSAPRVPSSVASLLVIGDQDPLFKYVKASIFDKLPVNPKNQYLEIKATHLTTPGEAADAVVNWIKLNF